MVLMDEDYVIMCSSPMFDARKQVQRIKVLKTISFQLVHAYNLTAWPSKYSLAIWR